MNNVKEHKCNSVRRQRSIHHVHYDLCRRDEMAAKPLLMPTSSLELQAYDTQVAGHKKMDDTKYLGLLQCNNGTILKPILKEAQRREVDFYNHLYSSNDPDLVELRKCTPKYFGCKKFTYNGYEQEYIILEDLTQRMLEPCVMDVKIGKRTWDPLATEEKKKNEQAKYALCKQEYSFCIPGFQVYKLATGKLHKYNKDYGKKLHGQAVKDAVRVFLSGGGGALCRALLLQLVSQAWRAQRWARANTKLKLYSASVLLAYDAAKLRACCSQPPNQPPHQLHTHNPAAPCRAVSLSRRRSIHSSHSPAAAADFSGQISAQGPVYKKLSAVPITAISLAQATFATPAPITSPWTEALERLNHNHSFEHNYEDKLSKIKMNYRALLDQLSYDTPNPKPWGTVAIIDFAHAFFNEEDQREVDENFRQGIDNFVEILEEFLRETDDQII